MYREERERERQSGRRIMIVLFFLLIASKCIDLLLDLKHDDYSFDIES